jgi:hypothetical protein
MYADKIKFWIKILMSLILGRDLNFQIYPYSRGRKIGCGTIRQSSLKPHTKNIFIHLTVTIISYLYLYLQIEMVKRYFSTGRCLCAQGFA